MMVCCMYYHFQLWAVFLGICRLSSRNSYQLSFTLCALIGSNLDGLCPPLCFSCCFLLFGLDGICPLLYFHSCVLFSKLDGLCPPLCLCCCFLFSELDGLCPPLCIFALLLRLSLMANSLSLNCLFDRTTFKTTTS